MPEYPDPAVLDGLRVIDWTAGPEASRASSLLADYGAEVVWIESPRRVSLDMGADVSRAVFARNKQSVVMDVTTEAGRSEMLSLLSRADALIVDESFTGDSEFDFSHVHARFPALVYCELSAFGPDAPGAENLPAYEALVHAYVGTMGEQVGYREPPIYEALPFAGLGRAYLAQIGVLAALLRRQTDGVGRCVSTSTLDGALSFLSMLWGYSDADEERPPRVAGGQRLVARTFLCADDQYIGVHTGAAGAFDRLLSVLGLSQQFPAVSNGLAVAAMLTDEQRRILEEDLPRLFLTQERSTWLDKLLAADVCAIPVLRPTEVFDEAQTRHNGMVVEVVDPSLGAIEQVAAPIRFGSGGNTPPTPRPAPEPGSTSAAEVVRTWEVREQQHPLPSAAPDEPLLAGLKVLDLGTWYAGAYSSRMLADLGADVIKIEPVAGDQIRGMRQPFQSAHSRKRSFAADLKDPGLTRAVEGLLAWADVVHHNMRPGAAERIGVGYERARQLNPDIVYLHAPGWGTSGPEMKRQSFAPLVSGYVGASYEVGGMFNPPTYPVGNEDPGAGMAGAIGILMALLHGGGTYIELPQLNAAMQQMAHIVRGSDGAVHNAGRLDVLQRRVSPLDGLYETTDSWICLTVLTESEFRALCKAIGIDLLADERFSSAQARHANADALAALLESVFETSSTADWLDRLGPAGVPAIEPVTAHNNRAFHLEPAHQRTRRISVTDGGDGTTMHQIDTLIRIGGAPIAPYRLAPGLGEHNRQVLTDFGYADPEIEALAARGAIADSPSGASTKGG